jgi:ethanolamine utilization protein EutQ (cupin superfamily)
MSLRNSVTTPLPKKTLKEELSEKLMEKILDMVNKNVQVHSRYFKTPKRKKVR